MNIHRNFSRAVAIAMVLGATACSSSETQNTVDGANDKLNQLGARAVAESFRTALKTKDLKNGQHQYDLVVINETVAALPGAPDVSGVVDGNGDLADDDGKVQFNSNGEAACVTISKTSDDTTVAGGKC